MIDQETRSLSDEELLMRAKDKTAQERLLTAEILKLLQEIDRRKIFAARGFSSLFSFCVEYLGYSEASAQRRVASVRLMNQIPAIEEKIKEGSLTLSNISQAQVFFQAEAKHKNEFTLEEKKAVLKQLEGKSTRQVERELIGLSSHPEDFIFKDKVRPVTETRFEIRFFAEQSLLDKLEHVRGLLAHRNSNLSMAELIEELARMAIEKLEPKKMKDSLGGKKCNSREVVIQAEAISGAAIPVSTPTRTLTPAPALKVSLISKEQRSLEDNEIYAKMDKLRAEEKLHPRSRYIPVSVRSEVYHRDGGVCSYRDEITGRKCESRFGLEYDHVHIPFAQGGEHTVQNIALKCYQHNSLNAIETYGLSHMEKFWKKNQKEAKETDDKTDNKKTNAHLRQGVI